MDHPSAAEDGEDKHPQKGYLAERERESSTPKY